LKKVELGAQKNGRAGWCFANQTGRAPDDWFREGDRPTDHNILSQRGLAARVVTSPTDANNNEANMPFLFWMPMIVMCGLWRAAEEDAKAFLPTEP